MYLALLAVGGLILLVGGIWLLVLAFKESVLWGLGSLFIPFVAIIFAATHWEVAKNPFLLYLLGVVLVIVATVAFAPETTATALALTPG